MSFVVVIVVAFAVALEVSQFVVVVVVFGLVVLGVAVVAMAAA
jgi:hypothetical protein